MGLFEAFYSSMKPVVLLNYNFEVQSGTKLPNGITELPFEFELKVSASHTRMRPPAQRTRARARSLERALEHLMIVCRTTSLLRGVPAVLAPTCGRDLLRMESPLGTYPVSLFSL